jgi:protein tyrosine/serine phosphatase
VITNYAVPQHDARAVDPKHSHPARGTSIIHFGEVDGDVYKGSKPKNDADFRFLHSKNVKTIVDLQFVPVLYRREKEQGEKYGIRVIPVTINASPISPSESHVRQALCLLADKSLRPIYFHCDVGRDRTSLIATLYEVYFRGLPPEKALQEMKRLGFKDDWTLRGLKNYLQQHADSHFTVESACR